MWCRKLIVKSASPLGAYRLGVPGASVARLIPLQARAKGKGLVKACNEAKCLLYLPCNQIIVVNHIFTLPCVPVSMAYE